MVNGGRYRVKTHRELLLDPTVDVEEDGSYSINESTEVIYHCVRMPIQMYDDLIERKDGFIIRGSDGTFFTEDKNPYGGIWYVASWMVKEFKTHKQRW